MLTSDIMTAISLVRPCAAAPCAPMLTARPCPPDLLLVCGPVERQYVPGAAPTASRPGVPLHPPRLSIQGPPPPLLHPSIPHSLPLSAPECPPPCPRSAPPCPRSAPECLWVTKLPPPPAADLYGKASFSSGVHSTLLQGSSVGLLLVDILAVRPPVRSGPLRPAAADPDRRPAGDSGVVREQPERKSGGAGRWLLWDPPPAQPAGPATHRPPARRLAHRRCRRRCRAGNLSFLVLQAFRPGGAVKDPKAICDTIIFLGITLLLAAGVLR
jgi:hypothetical protein